MLYHKFGIARFLYYLYASDNKDEFSDLVKFSLKFDFTWWEICELHFHAGDGGGVACGAALTM